MTRILISDGAAADIERLGDFLLERLPEEALRTSEVIFEGLEILSRHPEVGRPLEQGLRELVVSRGRTGYLALYAFDEEADVVIVLGVRHQREGATALRTDRARTAPPPGPTPPTRSS